MSVTIDAFLQGVQAITDKKPGYKLGHSGDDGWCDCIGLIIGALKRCGVTWTQATQSGAIHGSNWAARYALTVRFPTGLDSAAELSPGDLLFKYRTPGQSGYALPGRYREGKANDCGVYLDFMHVGVVTGVSPLRITHCAAGGIRVDTTLGKWRAYGRLKVLAAQGEAQPSVPETPPASAAQKVPPTQTVRYGSRGETVRRAQQLLNACGASLKVDGVFGARTENAVRSYQRTRGLAVDGVVGPRTWAALTEEAAR